MSRRVRRSSPRSGRRVESVGRRDLVVPAPDDPEAGPTDRARIRERGGSGRRRRPEQVGPTRSPPSPRSAEGVRDP